MEFRVLGPMEVSEGGCLLDFGPRMPRAILAVLLVDANRVVSLDRLIDQLWGENPPAKATSAVQVYISNLRRRSAAGAAMGAARAAPVSLRTSGRSAACRRQADVALGDHPGLRRAGHSGARR